jgi:hypothetical protein
MLPMLAIARPLRIALTATARTIDSSGELSNAFPAPIGDSRLPNAADIPAAMPLPPVPCLLGVSRSALQRRPVHELPA